jgi:hypothetical protein
VHIFERTSRGRKFRIASQSLWDPVRGHSVARQAVLGSAEPPPMADLASTQIVGHRAIGDVGALVWVAEQLDLVGLIDRTSGLTQSTTLPSLGEMVVAVAIQRACAPGPKIALAAFLAGSLPRVSCLPAAKFTGQAFHRLAKHITEADLERIQVVLARAIVERFSLQTEVLAFDTTNFDTHIATPTPGNWHGGVTPRASGEICAWSGWVCWSARPNTSHCSTVPFLGIAPTKRCCEPVWKD